MPKKVHDKLAREAKKKFGSTSSQRAKAYIYGTLNKIDKKRKK